MTREFSSDSREWLNNYHGSIDSTALLLAFDAGVASLTAQLQAAQATIAEVKAAWFGPCKFDLAIDGPKVSDVLSRTETSALAAVKAATWDEGYSQGREDHCDWWGGPDDCDVATHNPYRAASKREGAE